MSRARVAAIFGLAAGLLASTPGVGQTLGSVFGPSISEEDTEVELRLALRPSEGDAPSAISSRIHFQDAVSDRLRWRIIAQGVERQEDFELDSFRGELQWQFLERTPSGWSAALRFDVIVTDGDARPDRLRLNLTTEKVFGTDGNWRFRALALTRRDIDGDGSGMGLELRTAVARRIPGAPGGLRLGVETFNGLGRTTSFGSFDEQNHRVGPAISASFGGGWRGFGSVLFGVSDRAADADVRFFVARRF